MKISDVRASVFRNTGLNKSSITCDQSAEDAVILLPHSCFVLGLNKANVGILIVNKKRFVNAKGLKANCLALSVIDFMPC